MQFSIVAILSLAAVALGSPVDPAAAIKARQIAGAPAVNEPAMTDASGQIKKFDAADVYLPSEGAAQ